MKKDRILLLCALIVLIPFVAVMVMMFTLPVKESEAQRVGAGSITKAEDAAHATGDVGTMSLTVRQDTATALAGTDADYQPLVTDANGRLHVLDANSAAGLTALQLIDNVVFVDDADWTDSTSSHALVGGIYQSVPQSITDGDTGPIQVDANGNVIIATGSAATDLAKAEDAAHTTGDVGVMSLSVRQDTSTALGADGDYQPVSTDEFGRVYVNDGSIIETGILELIGINDATMPTNDYGDSVSFSLGATVSGEIAKMCLFATEDDAGAIITEDMTVLVFDADPTITASDATITAAERLTIIADFSFVDANWDEDANGASICVTGTNETFHAVATLYFAVVIEGATSWNSAANDDEQLEANIFIRRAN